MILRQAELFKGMNRGFVKGIMDLTKKESFKEGDILFTEGDRAEEFFILLRGRVKLSIGEGGRIVHVVGRPGEAFGWSSLVGRDAYTASAKCMAPTKLLKMGREDIQRILEDDPANGLVFVKRVSVSIGERLVNAYNSLRSIHHLEFPDTCGTSQTLRQRSAL